MHMGTWAQICSWVCVRARMGVHKHKYVHGCICEYPPHHDNINVKMSFFVCGTECSLDFPDTSFQSQPGCNVSALQTQQPITSTLPSLAGLWLQPHFPYPVQGPSCMCQDSRDHHLPHILQRKIGYIELFFDCSCEETRGAGSLGGVLSISFWKHNLYCLPHEMASNTLHSLSPSSPLKRVSILWFGFCHCGGGGVRSWCVFLR